MNISCPNCRAKSRIADDRVPLAGAWARCPKCRNRFFIRPLQPEPAIPADSAPHSETARDDLRQRILRRVRGNATQAYTSQSPDTGEPPEVFVFPEPALSNAACAALGLALLAIPLLFIGLFFKSASSWRPAPEAPITRVSAADQTRQTQYVINDLLWLRSRTIQRKTLQYTVNYSGSESKIFKYYLARLAPGVCPDITRLTIKSKNPAYGLTATATCLDPLQGQVLMRIDWAGNSAIISLPAHNLKTEVKLEAQ